MFNIDNESQVKIFIYITDFFFSWINVGNVHYAIIIKNG